MALLAEDPRSRVLAGGASLVAMLNAGLIEAPVLVSLKESGERWLLRLPDGAMRIGAMTRHCETAQSEQLSGVRRCLALAAASIGNMPVRNMGTIGGSVSLADPGADYPAALVALGSAIEVCNLAGTRTIPASAFFTDWYATALASGDLVTAILLPPAHAGIGTYRKLARVAGDFAIVSIALLHRPWGRRFRRGSVAPDRGRFSTQRSMRSSPPDSIAMKELPRSAARSRILPIRSMTSAPAPITGGWSSRACCCSSSARSGPR